MNILRHLLYDYKFSFISKDPYYGNCTVITVFIFDCQSENPGPGNYIGQSHADKISPSYSKKGTGGFASKVLIKISTNISMFINSL